MFWPLQILETQCDRKYSPLTLCQISVSSLGNYKWFWLWATGSNTDRHTSQRIDGNFSQVELWVPWWNTEWKCDSAQRLSWWNWSYIILYIMSLALLWYTVVWNWGNIETNTQLNIPISKSISTNSKWSRNWHKMVEVK